MNLSEDNLLDHMIEDTKWYVAYYGKYVRLLPKTAETFYHKQYRIGQRILKELLKIKR